MPRFTGRKMMLLLAAFSFVAQIGFAPPPLSPPLARDTNALAFLRNGGVAARLDTMPPRPRPVELSDWYARRLAIHRGVAYATLPLFAAQWIAGNRLYADSRSGAESPEWAKMTHRVGATALAVGFTANTITGAWNWWETRKTPEHRALRTVHALSMLASDAAFTYAGAKLADEAEQSASKRRMHRQVALSAMSLATVSELAMMIWNR
jgi:hypothetical protein